MKVSPALLEKILEEHYDSDEIIEQGDEWIVPSLVDSSKMKLYINLDKGKAIDFIGGQGYSARSLIGAIKNLDRNELDQFIIEFALKRAAGMKVSDFIKSDKPKITVPPIIIPVDYPKEDFLDILGEGYTANKVRSYLANRQISTEQIKRYHLQYAYKGKFAGRVIIPFIDDREVVWFQARAVSPNAYLRYDNPKGAKRTMLVYNIDAIDKVAIICEGPFDAMTVNGQAIMGSQLSEWQALKIWQKKPEKIIIVPDEDYIKKLGVSPGYRGAIKSVERLLDKGCPLERINIAFVDGGKDLNDLGTAKALDVLRGAVPVNFSTVLRFKRKGAISKRLEKVV